MAEIDKKWHDLMLDEILREKRLEKTGITPKVGMKVLIKEEKKRSIWKKAEIRESIKGHDGRFESVVIKDSKTTKPVKRHLKDLIPL